MKKNKEYQTEKNREITQYYTHVFADTVREPFIILNSDLQVISANNSFYTTFRVTKKQTENQLIFNLGNGQWNIPKLRKLLERILPEKKVFNDFEVSNTFPNIGFKIMLLNARQLDSTQQILLAIEDITLKKTIAKKLANYTKSLEKGISEKTTELKARVDELSKLNKLMVGRELKMAELKKEIQRLKN